MHEREGRWTACMHILILLAASSDSGENLGTYIYIYTYAYLLYIYTCLHSWYWHATTYVRACTGVIGRAYIMIASWSRFLPGKHRLHMHAWCISLTLQGYNIYVKSHWVTCMYSALAYFGNLHSASRIYLIRKDVVKKCFTHYAAYYLTCWCWDPSHHPAISM